MNSFAPDPSDEGLLDVIASLDERLAKPVMEHEKDDPAWLAIVATLWWRTGSMKGSKPTPAA